MYCHLSNTKFNSLKLFAEDHLFNENRKLIQNCCFSRLFSLFQLIPPFENSFFQKLEVLSSLSKANIMTESIRDSSKAININLFLSKISLLKISK
jgi:hypothetical protein